MYDRDNRREQQGEQQNEYAELSEKHLVGRHLLRAADKALRGAERLEQRELFILEFYLTRDCIGVLTDGRDACSLAQCAGSVRR